MKLELPWITGDVLIKRWEISLKELHQIIFELNLPVYNAQHTIETEPEERGYLDGEYYDKDAKWITDYNNLYEFDALIHRMKRNPRDNEGALEILESLYFKIEDVRQFESEYSINRNGTPDNPIMVTNIKKVNSLTADDARELGRLRNEKSKQLETQKVEEEEVDEIISKIAITYENDNELRISYPNRPSQTYRCNHIGFSDSGKKTVWKSLIKILESNRNIYNIGPSHRFEDGIKQRVPEYDTRRARLMEINKKLRSFLSGQYSITFPNGYKLYELDTAEERGTYRFKFQIDQGIDSQKNPIYQKFERLDKNTFIDLVKTMAAKLETPERELYKERISVACEFALKKKLMTPEEFSNLISQYS